MFFVTFAPMKRRLFIIGIALLLTLVSCHNSQHEARQMVRRAEQLCDTNPDSTVSLIDSVLRMPVYFNEGRRMDIDMLQAEALFGDHGVREIPPLMDDEFFDDKPFLTTSPELERAADYYARKKQYDKAAHAALYSGFIQQHYSEKTIAMQSFKDAERYGGMAVDSLTVMFAKYWMGKMLFEDGSVQESVIILENSEKGFNNNYSAKALVKNMLAVCHMVLGDFENAEMCLHQSLVLSEKAHVNKVKCRVLNNYAVLYRLQGKFDLSLNNLRQTTECCNPNDAELFTFLLNMGKTFMAARKMDSATVYYQRIEDLLSVVHVKNETKVSAYGALSRFEEVQNNIQLALQYRQKHEEFLYEVIRQQQEQNIYRIQQQYDYENLQNALNRKIIFRHRIILIISLLLFTATAIILVLQLRHKQMQEAEAEMQRQIENLKNDLKQSVKTSYLEQELSSRLRLIISAYLKQKNGYDPKNEWSSIVYKLMNGKESLFDAVLVEMGKVYPDIYTVLRQKYPELNETETKVCLLSCSDLSNTEMAEILEMSKFTIDKNRSKLRDKLNLKPEKMKEQLHQVLSH